MTTLLILFSAVLALIASTTTTLGGGHLLINKHSKQAFVFVPGQSVKPEQYVPLLEGLSTTVVIVKYPFDTQTTDKQTMQKIDEAVFNMQQKVQVDGVFYGGHSRGGILVQDYLKSQEQQQFLVQDQSDKLDNLGLVLFSSALQRKYRPDYGGEFLQEGYPILTMSGELDGLFRVFRLAEAYYHSTKDSPVLVLKGASHISFLGAAAGNPPLFTKALDLKAEVPEEQVHREIVSAVDTFFAQKSEYLKQAQNESAEYFQPIVEALELEGNYHLKKPCSEVKDGRDCWSGSRWAEMMQEELVRLPNKRKSLEKSTVVSSIDAFWKVWLINPVHLPNVTSEKCTEQKNCHVDVTTVTQGTYAKIDRFDFGFQPVAADELRTKFKSIQSVHEAAGIKEASSTEYFADVDDNKQICQQLNQKSLQWALSKANDKALKRYIKFGVQMRIGEDLGPYNAGPQWIWKSLTEKVLKNEKSANGRSVVEISSPCMRTPQDYFIKLSAGFHYCKLLSPARALERIYIDSLREFYKL